MTESKDRAMNETGHLDDLEALISELKHLCNELAELERSQHGKFAEDQAHDLDVVSENIRMRIRYEIDKYKGAHGVRIDDICAELGSNRNYVTRQLNNPNLTVKAAQELIDATNRVRESAGIPRIAFDARGCSIAERQSELVKEASQRSIEYICSWLDPERLKLLESIAEGLYRDQYPYGANFFYVMPGYTQPKPLSEWDSMTDLDKAVAEEVFKCARDTDKNNEGYQRVKIGEEFHVIADRAAKDWPIQNANKDNEDPPETWRDFTWMLNSILYYEIIYPAWRAWAEIWPPDQRDDPAYHRLMVALDKIPNELKED